MRSATTLLREGRDCLTLAVVHDPEVTRYVPDLSHAMRALWRFPWERGEATPAGRALRATGAGPDRATELPFYGLDLDGVFLPDVPDAVYHADIAEAVLRRHGLEPFPTLPFFSPERAVVITGRPDSDRERTQAWLARWGHGALPLECRPADMPHNPDTVARYKAEAATRWGCTHFVESDAEQALRIAAHAPHLVVSWWSATRRTRVADRRGGSARAVEAATRQTNPCPRTLIIDTSRSSIGVFTPISRASSNGTV